jgi:hypothetical protein
MMKTYLIKNEADLEDYFTKLQKKDSYPITIQAFKGESKHRSLEQSALVNIWYRDIAKQAEDRTTQEVTRECKLNLGVPILRGESEKFREVYDRVVGDHDYETTLEMMDYLPVTSSMTVVQMTDYIDTLYHTYTDAGFYLETKEQ